MINFTAMKYTKLTLGFLIIIATSNLNGQSKISFGLSSSYLFNNRLLTNFESNVYRDYRNSKEGFLEGFDIATNIAYDFNNKISFESGIGYSKNGYSVKEERIIDPGFSPLTAGYYSDLYRLTYDNIYIPIHLDYHNSRKLQYCVNFGPSLIIPLTEKVEYILRKTFESSVDQKVISNPNPSGLKTVNISFDLGLGIGYHLNDKIQLTLLPKASVFLLGNENTWIKDTLYNINLFNGEDRSSKDHLINMGLEFKITFKP